MAFITKKKIHGKEYFYLVERKRENGRVKSKTLAYLGKTKKEAEEKAKGFLEGKEKSKKEEKVEKKKDDRKFIPEFAGYDYDRTLELASRKSIFYPAAEIYPNTPKGFWDFGPVGQAIRRKIVEFWRKELVQKENMLEIHGSQILPISVFEGSGHLKSFSDPIIYCTKCKGYERADQLVSQKTGKHVPESTPIEKLDRLIKENNVKCPICGGEFGKVTRFNMMVESIVGKEGDNKTFLRPESCQSIFLNFPRMVKTMRLKLPQGIAQAGGVFRNEISPRQSITRSIEFSQMEAEIFFDPEKINEIDNEKWNEIKNYKLKILRLGNNKTEEISAQDLVKKKIVQGKLIAYYLARTQQVWVGMGIPLEKVRFREVDKDERAFYSLVTFDLEVETSIGWLELIANNYRTDYDLKGHMEHSKTDLRYLIDEGQKIIPHIWEISAGIDRTMFALIENSFKKGKEGIYLSLDPKIAAYNCAVLPLVNREDILKLSKEVEKILKDAWFDVFYDKGGSIGRRYARQDETGTPYCITIDGESLKKKDVTIRNRDDTKQIRVKVKDLKEILRKLISEEVKFLEVGPLIK